MAKKRKDNLQEYKFKIDAYSPETMPLGRLAEYLTDLSTLFGEDKSVHLIRVEGGSTVPVFLVEREAEPKIRDQFNAIDRGEAPPEVMKVVRSINERLRKDNAKGGVTDPKGGELIFFPGREQAEPLVYGPFTQAAVVTGIPRAVGGDNDPVPVHIRGAGGQTFNCWAKEDLARQIAAYLFKTVIRAEGTARIVRNAAGEWETSRLTIKSFKPLSDASLRESIEALRAIPAEWKKGEDPLRELHDIRHGTDG